MTQLALTLTDPGPPMWFFNDGEYNLHLTFLEGRNSVYVETEKLSDRGIQYIIGSIQGQHIVASLTVGELFDILGNRVRKNLQVAEEARKVILAEGKQWRDVDVLEQRCKFIAASTTKAVKSAICDETNQLVLLRVLELEKQGKRRKAVIQFIEEHIVALRRKKALLAARTAKALPSTDKTPTMGYTVEEEGEELVEISVAPNH